MKRRNLAEFAAWIGALCAILGMLGGAGCADREPKPVQLDVATVPDTTDPDADWVHKRQALHKIEIDGMGNRTESDAGWMTAVGDIQADCAIRIVPPGSATICEQQYYSNLRLLCLARTMLALASPQSEPIRLTDDLGNQIWTIMYDRVTEPESVVAATYAIKAASKVKRDLLITLSDTSTANACRSPSTGLFIQTSQGTISGPISATIVDAYHLARQAYDRAVEATVNASDNLASSTGSEQLAAQRAIAGAELSRAAAAHLLVGGDPGLLGSTTQPFCAGADLTPQARSALKILRDAAPSPATLLGATGTAALLNTGTDSVRQRLGDFYGIDKFKTSTGLGVLEGYYNLSLSDFDAARTYLNQEILAFNRPQSAMFPTIGTALQRRFAGVFGDPRPLPKGAWAGRARYWSVPPPWLNVASGAYEYVWDVESDPPPLPLDAFIANTHTTIRMLTGAPPTFAGPGDDAALVKQRVLGTLDSILVSNEYRGMLELVTQPNAMSPWAHGYTLADKVRVVVGEDGLRCAVDGTIEGVSCQDPAVSPPPFPCAAGVDPTLSCLTVYTLTRQVAVGNSIYGERSYVSTPVGTTISAPNIAALIAAKQRLYYVKLRDPSLGEKPGNYELLGSAIPTSGSSVLASTPIVPSVQARVDEILAPNRKFCGVQETSCTGLLTDSRIPLENELTDDNNGVESSWKHYLGLAQQAAQESDLAGSELRAAKLNSLQLEAAQQLRQEEQQQAAESALQEVQAACGTAIDPKRLLTLLSSPSVATTQPDLGKVYGGQACPCPANSGLACLGGVCMVDFVALADLYPQDPDVTRLRDCIDERPSAASAFVTLGDQRLCVYTRAGNPNDVCPASLLGTNACPSIKPTTGSCAPIASTDAYDAEPLTFYKYEGGSGNAGACQLFRQLRTSHLPADLSLLVNTNALHPVRLRDRVGKIAFVAKYGSYVSITEDGVERFSTGSIVGGKATTNWPWVPLANCPAGSKGLFCSTITDATRGAFNGRLFQAAYAAEWMRSGKGLAADYPIALNASAVQWRPWLADECVSGGDPSTIYEVTTNTPISVCTKKLPDGVEVTTYKYNSVNASTGWLRPDGTAMQAPLNFGHWPSSRVSIKNSIASDFGVFSGLSMSMLAFASGDQTSNGRWMKRVLLSDGLENEFSNVFDLSDPNNEFTNMGDKVGSLALVDGLEMLCELSEKHISAVATAPSLPLASLEDVDRAGSYIKTLADSIIRNASQMVFARMPRIASEALGDVSPTGAFPALSGRMGEEVSRLREALVAVRSALPAISGTMQQLGAEMQSLRARLDQIGAENGIIDYNLLGTTLDRMNGCAQSINAAELAGSYGIGVAAQCANSAAQIAIAMQISSLQKRANNDAVEIARAAFAERMSQLTQNLQSAALGLQDASERINGALSAIDGLRKQARLSMARAVHVGSYTAQKQVEYNKAAGSLTALAQVRYQKALKSAKQMTFLAKRSVEQRLGIRLSEMRDPMPLVDAPALWEGSLCSLGGTDDTALESLDGQDIAKFGDAFIGDYVKKLANVVESYSLMYNFHEGEDVAVVSVRDDIKNVRRGCALPSANLFHDSSELDASTSWGPTNCSATPAVNCIAAQPLVDASTKASELAITGLPTNINGAVGYKLVFGDGNACVAGNCTYRANAALSQVVTLKPGRYRFSWYTKEAPATTGGAQIGIAKIRPTSAAVPAVDLVLAAQCNAPCGSSMTCAAGCFSHPLSNPTAAWKRASMEFMVNEPGGAYEVGFGTSDATRPVYTVTVAAPMLENVRAAGATALPGFQATSTDGTVEFNDCEDTRGELFRANAWRRECVHLCDTGFSANCTTGPEYCYRELTFGVSQPWIQNGKLFKFSGFARGNFNYRIDSVALNFVGSGVRDCDESTTPSTCFNAGFVPYSMEHNGPFFVRNHAGADFKALLFDGRIEHARGLGLERYLTNPLSATDRELLTDYMRGEFKGRPLDGAFVLRVWEEPGVDFDSIEDVQLVLKYRYWTRFE